MWYRNVLSLVIDYLINFPPPLSDQIYKSRYNQNAGRKKKR